MKNILLFCIVAVLISCNAGKKPTTEKSISAGLQSFAFDVANCSGNNFSDYFENNKNSTFRNNRSIATKKDIEHAYKRRWNVDL